MEIIVKRLVEWKDYGDVEYAKNLFANISDAENLYEERVRNRR